MEERIDRPGRSYPVGRPDSDPRFTFGLLVDVVGVLEGRGYPRLSGADLVKLQQALFQFLYSDEPKPEPLPTRAPGAALAGEVEGVDR